MKAIPWSASILSEHVPRTFCLTTSCISLTKCLLLQHGNVQNISFKVNIRDLGPYSQNFIILKLKNDPNKLECFITLGWRGFPLTNTLGYWTNLWVKKKMKCCEYDTCIVKHNGFIMYRYLTNLVCLSFPVKVTHNNKKH
jgi:hypothetical protein